MKKVYLIVIMFSIFTSLAAAQQTYLGAGIALPIIEYGTLPLVAVQVGTLVADHVELRANIDTLIVFAGLFGADILYTDTIADSNARWCAGGGINGLYVASQIGGVLFGLHAPAGAEFFIDLEKRTGIFVEAQPIILFVGVESPFIFNLRTGVNFHF